MLPSQNRPGWNSIRPTPSSSSEYLAEQALQAADNASRDAEIAVQAASKAAQQQEIALGAAADAVAAAKKQPDTQPSQ